MGRFKTTLLGSVYGRKFRLMRDEQGHQSGGAQSGGDSGTQSNNSGSNTGQSGADSTGNNNSGQSFDYGAFWGGSGEESGDAPSGESAVNSNPSSGRPTQQTHQETKLSPAEQLAKDIGGLAFNDVMTPDAMEKLSNGDTAEFQKGINAMGQQAVQHAIRLMLPLMGTLRDQLRGEIQNGISGNNKSRENESALLQAIPSAADPKVRPLVDAIFDKAMQHSKGDRKSALSMTKDMLRIQMETLGNDVGIPPRTSGDGFSTPGNINWADELLGR